MTKVGSIIAKTSMNHNNIVIFFIIIAILLNSYTSIAQQLILVEIGFEQLFLFRYEEMNNKLVT